MKCSSLRLALSLVRVPKLFVSLLLVPLLAGIAVVWIQSYISGLIAAKESQTVEERLKKGKERSQAHPLRVLITGIPGELPPIKVCQWISEPDGTERLSTAAPKDCALKRFDPVIRKEVLTAYTLDEYRSMFNSHFLRMHLCESCNSDIIMRLGDNGKPETHFYSAPAYVLVRLVKNSNKYSEAFKGRFQKLVKITQMTGGRFFHAPGFIRPAGLTEMAKSFVLLVNLAMLAIAVVYLAMKAHRKVLEYFAESGALLPLVAATGKTTFYRSIWILTILRVSAFLLMSLPIASFTMRQYVEANLSEIFYYNTIGGFLLWGVAIMCSITLSMLIGSIADLKHRHSIINLCYKFVPMILAMSGLTLWLLSLLITEYQVGTIRHVIAAIPIVGMGPVLLAPILPPPDFVLVINAVLSVALLVTVIRANARWFAAHLDEI